MLDPKLYRQTRPIQISNTTVSPSENLRIQYLAGHLPSGTRVPIQIEVFRSDVPGPHVLVVGGIHGDEINGIEVVRRTLEQHLYGRLTTGSVIVMPLLNVYGFINFSREVPDGKDVNRSFPGTLNGSMASRVAGIVTKQVLPQVDVVIDCHTGALNRFNFPQVRVTKGDSTSIELGRAFQAPFLLHKSSLRGSLRKTAHISGKPCLIYEGGEALRYDGVAISRGVEGITRILHKLDMIRDAPMPRQDVVEIYHSTWVRAGTSGLFLWTKSSGKRVVKGEPLGSISDPYGTHRLPVISPRDGFIIGHTNSAVVHQGDALFHIGF